MIVSVAITLKMAIVHSDFLTDLMINSFSFHISVMYTSFSVLMDTFLDIEFWAGLFFIAPF